MDEKGDSSIKGCAVSTSEQRSCNSTQTWCWENTLVQFYILWVESGWRGQMVTTDLETQPLSLYMRFCVYYSYLAFSYLKMEIQTIAVRYE